MNSATQAEHFLDERESLACIHCGLCLASCPTYLETGNENDSPRGRIYLMRALQAGRLPLDKSPVRHIDLCLGCRACEAVCPSGVEYGHLLEHTRDHIGHNHRRSLFQIFLRRYAIEQIFPHPGRMRLALRPARLLKSLGVERLLPKFARDALSLLPENMSAVHLPECSPSSPNAPLTPSLSPSDGERVAEGRVRRRVGFLSGCVMSVMFGETNANSVKLLNLAGCDVITPPHQGCCGALYAHGGNLEAARDAARRNITAFERLNLDAIIINAAGCGSTLKEYGGLLQHDDLWSARAHAFSAKVKDLTEFLVMRWDSLAGKFNTANSGQRVTYHDACHLAHAQRIAKPPRELVKAVAGKHYVELPESEVCCGSAGSYNLTEPEMAERLQRRKTENIRQTAANIVVTTNPGCLLQIRAGLKKAGRQDVEALHIADYLVRNLI